MKNLLSFLTRKKVPILKEEDVIFLDKTKLKDFLGLSFLTRKSIDYLLNRGYGFGCGAIGNYFVSEINESGETTFPNPYNADEWCKSWQQAYDNAKERMKLRILDDDTGIGRNGIVLELTSRPFGDTSISGGPQGAQKYLHVRIRGYWLRPNKKENSYKYSFASS